MSRLERTKEGHLILDRKPAQDRGSEIVCCVLEDNGNHPLVVWRMDADGNTHGGDYCGSLLVAADAFRWRR